MLLPVSLTAIRVRRLAHVLAARLSAIRLHLHLRTGLCLERRLRRDRPRLPLSLPLRLALPLRLRLPRCAVARLRAGLAHRWTARRCIRLSEGRARHARGGLHGWPCRRGPTRRHARRRKRRGPRGAACGATGISAEVLARLNSRRIGRPILVVGRRVAIGNALSMFGNMRPAPGAVRVALAVLRPACPVVVVHVDVDVDVVARQFGRAHPQ